MKTFQSTELKVRKFQFSLSQGAGFGSKRDRNVMVAAMINALLCQEEVVSVLYDTDKYVQF